MKLNRTGLNRRPGSRTTHQVQLRSVGGTYCNLRHTHTPGTTDNRKRGFVKHLALHANGKWTSSNKDKKIWFSLCGGPEGGRKMWLVVVRERWGWGGGHKHYLCLWVSTAMFPSWRIQHAWPPCLQACKPRPIRPIHCLQDPWEMELELQ